LGGVHSGEEGKASKKDSTTITEEIGDRQRKGRKRKQGKGRGVWCSVLKGKLGKSRGIEAADSLGGSESPTQGQNSAHKQEKLFEKGYTSSLRIHYKRILKSVFPCSTLEQNSYSSKGSSEGRNIRGLTPYHGT